MCLFGKNTLGTRSKSSEAQNSNTVFAYLSCVLGGHASRREWPLQYLGNIQKEIESSNHSVAEAATDMKHLKLQNVQKYRKKLVKIYASDLYSLINESLHAGYTK